MAEKIKKSGVSFFNANLTPIISVALVLLLLGLVALMAIAGKNLTNQIKENIGFDVVISDSATPQDVDNMQKLWKSAYYTSSVKYISKEEALSAWEKETGENLMQTLGVNPLSAEFEVRVKPQYASVDSLNKIEKGIQNVPGIESIEMQRDLVRAIDNNINHIALVLTGIAAILLIISFALINNTVRLTVYSKRFLIHTMKLVGAKSGFIRKPIIISNVINGVIASFVAILAIGVSLFYAVDFVDVDIMALLPTEMIVYVCAGIVVLGIVLCASAAFLAANKFIRLDYDDLFKR